MSDLRITRRGAGILLAGGLAAGLVVLSGPVGAAPPTLTAAEAYQRLAQGDLVLLDIREPEEWAETGVAEGAWPVSMHAPDFNARLAEILTRVPPEQVALICARGGRSNAMARALEEQGVAGMIDVPEGMLGRIGRPGWIAQGLPVVEAATAMQRYEAAMGAP